MSTTIQESLFPDKRDFVGEVFVKTHLTEVFTGCVKRGISGGFDIINNVADLMPMSLSLRAHNMHEAVCNKVKSEIEAMMPDANIRFYGTIAGNQRNFFEYNGIQFIYKKDVDSKNKSSKVTQIIDSQESDKHIITIQYNVSPLWDDILSVSFLYLKNGNTIFAHSISMSGVSTGLTFDNYNDVDDVEVATPKLKEKIAVSI